MRIQELERQVGIERATIRFYEKEGLITPRRQENGYRDYSEEDAAELRRIKLLRELGVSLDTIRNLQAGTEDFAAVMQRQSRILQGRRDQMERARTVCERISEDNTSYLGLDIDRYQNLLNAPQPLLPPGQGSGGSIFTERNHREPHPWRRFFARFLDYELTCAVAWFLMTVVLRWRFSSQLYSIILAYAIWYLQVPIEASWIHFLGTTPGKWLFGIRVEAIEGGKLTYSDALERAWRAYYAGMGLNIPGLRLFCFWRGYKAHTDNWDTDWDEYSEISFRDFKWKNWVLLALAYGAAVGINVVSELDAQLPRYRSNRLTTAQFASNYNFYYGLQYKNSLVFMERDGTLRETGGSTYMVLPDYGQLKHDPQGEFEYEMEGYTIKAITLNHTWYEYDYGIDFSSLWEMNDPEGLAHWAPAYCRLALLTAIASQENISPGKLSEYTLQLEQDMLLPASDGVMATYGSVTCTWDLDLELFLDYPEDSTTADIYEVTLDLRIEFP